MNEAAHLAYVARENVTRNHSKTGALVTTKWSCAWHTKKNIQKISNEMRSLYGEKQKKIPEQTVLAKQVPPVGWI